MVSLAVYGGQVFANPFLWRDAKAIVVGAAAYTSLFVFITLLMNRAMIVCLLYAFAWETVVPNMPGSMYYLSITSYLSAIAERPPGASNDVMQLLAGNIGENLLTPTVAIPIMAVLVVCFVIASMTWFTKFEFVPREDAE
jgi:ABC-2 type transport system permease protein